MFHSPQKRSIIDKKTQLGQKMAFNVQKNHKIEGLTPLLLQQINLNSFLSSRATTNGWRISFIAVMVLFMSITMKSEEVAFRHALEFDDEWDSIKVLVTRRYELDQKFGRAIYRDSAFSIYKIKAGRLRVRFPLQRDITDWGCKDWFSADTIIEFKVLPDNLNISQLKYDIQQFERIPGDDGNEIYSNPAQGIDFTVNDSEGVKRVAMIAFYPSRDQLHCKCK
jgi:hypothetical protein